MCGWTLSKTAGPEPSLAVATCAYVRMDTHWLIRQRPNVGVATCAYVRMPDVMTNKALYSHKRTGDLFAIETDESGKVVSTSGPLLSKDLDPEALDYDSYWDGDIRANIDGFELLSQAEYRELLQQTGFFVQESQRSIFSELNRRKD